MTTRQAIDRTLQANKDHQYALKVYTERLEAELASVDKLIASAESYDDSGEETQGIVNIPGAKKPKALVPLNSLLSEDSPFFEDATWRKTYEEYTTINPMKSKDHELLSEAVRTENKRLYAQEAQKRGEPITDKLPTHPPSYWEQNAEGLDWKRIAMKFSSTSNAPARTPIELRIRWLGHAHPKFSHATWTPEETEKLRHIVAGMRTGSSSVHAANGGKEKVDWVKVADVLGTNRTPFDCMRHGTSRRAQVWTPESDMKLLDAVKLYGGNNWTLVALAVSPDATAHACQKRFNDTLDPSLKRGPWSADEDTRLLKAIAGFWQPISGTGISRTQTDGDEETTERGDEEGPLAGPSNVPSTSKSRPATKSKNLGVPIPWPDVATFIPGRNNNQCRERYNVLVSSANKGKGKANTSVVEDSEKGKDSPTVNTVNRTRWTADEDERLKTSAQELGAETNRDKWADVAERVGNGRGWVVCKKRYEKLKKLDAASSESRMTSSRVDIGSETSQTPLPLPIATHVQDTATNSIESHEVQTVPVGAAESEATTNTPSEKRRGKTKGISAGPAKKFGKGKGATNIGTQDQETEPASSKKTKTNSSEKAKARLGLSVSMSKEATSSVKKAAPKKATAKGKDKSVSQRTLKAKAKSITNQPEPKSPTKKTNTRRPRPAYKVDASAEETEAEAEEEDVIEYEEEEPTEAGSSTVHGTPRPFMTTNSASVPASRKRKREDLKGKGRGKAVEDGAEGAVGKGKKRKTTSTVKSITSKRSTSSSVRKGRRSSTRDGTDNGQGDDATAGSGGVGVISPGDDASNMEGARDRAADKQADEAASEETASASRATIIAESGRRRSARIAKKVS